MIGFATWAMVAWASIGATTAGTYSNPTSGAAVAIRIGLTPERLAAAGVDGQTIVEMLGRLRQSPALGQWQNAAQSVDSIGRQLTALAELHRRDPLDAAVSSQLAAVRQSLRSARQVLLGCESAVGEALCQNLAPATAAKLQALGASARRGTPVEFGVVFRSATSWRVLGRAIVCERRAQRSGSTVPAPLAASLAEARANQHVQQAALSVATYLVAVQTAMLP